jgi:transmembrane sensor
MLRPSENDIWQVLDGKDSRAAEKVAVWLSSEEGLNWISDNSDEIFRKLTESESEVDVSTEEMLENIHRQIRMLIRKRKLRRIASVAAAVLLPVMFISLFWININSRVGNILFASSETVSESAALGERKVVVFQDGTKVYLNAGSKLSYPSFWTLSERDVKLEGEAFFQVEKNPKRPFVVDMNGVSLTVYGTRFNAKAYPHDDMVTVILFDGDVVFNASGNEYDLEPSEQLEYSRSSGNVEIISLESPDDQILWTKNVIMFRNNTLREIADVLSRWYNVSFVMEDELLYSRTFTLKTDHQPLHVLLEEMEYVSDLHFEVDGNVVKVTQNKK